MIKVITNSLLQFCRIKCNPSKPNTRESHERPKYFSPVGNGTKVNLRLRNADNVGIELEKTDKENFKIYVTKDRHFANKNPLNQTYSNSFVINPHYERKMRSGKGFRMQDAKNANLSSFEHNTSFAKSQKQIPNALTPVSNSNVKTRRKKTDAFDFSQDSIDLKLNSSMANYVKARESRMSHMDKRNKRTSQSKLHNFEMLDPLGKTEFVSVLTLEVSQKHAVSTNDIKMNKRKKFHIPRSVSRQIFRKIKDMKGDPRILRIQKYSQKANKSFFEGK